MLVAATLLATIALDSSFEPRTLPFAEVSSSHAAARELLETVLSDGLAYVNGLPLEEEAAAASILELARWLTPSGATVAQEKFWAKGGSNTTTYLHDQNRDSNVQVKAQHLRTEGAYLAHSPRVVLVGCVYFQGAEYRMRYPRYIWTDVRAAADMLSEAHRETLSTKKIGFEIEKDEEVDEVLKATHATLSTGPERVFWNAEAQVAETVDDENREALGALAAAMARRKMQLNTKLEPGSVALVDNWRVAHVRESYVGGRRRTVGSHMPDLHVRHRITEALEKEAAEKASKDEL